MIIPDFCSELMLCNLLLESRYVEQIPLPTHHADRMTVSLAS
jgi:hypothetical protein